MTHAFFWTATGGMVDLGTLGGNESTPTDINDCGQIVGSSRYPTGTGPHAFSWTLLGGMTDLAALAEQTTRDSRAVAVNNAGQVVGYAPASNPNWNRPFLWTAAGGIQYLGMFPGGPEVGEAGDGVR